MSLRQIASSVGFVCVFFVVGCGGVSVNDDGGASGGSAGGRAAAGGNAAGGSVAGGNAAGGNVAGGSAAGGNVAGGNAAGGLVAGGSAAGGDAAGGAAGGSIGGGTTAGGDAGGSVGGGNSAGGDSAGGNAAGGNFGGGNFGGGLADGGTSGGGNVGGGLADGGTSGGGNVGGGNVGGGSACIPSSEICDGLDNNCNGTIDEGVTILCSADPDNDRYATSTATTPVCPDPLRPVFGSCPAGYTSPATSLGIDCAPNNALAFQQLAARTDADNDSRCIGATFQACVGLTLGAGQRTPANCMASDDCNDGNAQLFQLLSTRADADADSFCAGTAMNECSGATANAGRRLSASCMSADDCNDTNPQLFQLLSTRGDVDGDSFCTGTATNECSGAAVATGRRLANTCLGDDCNDSSASLFTVSTFIVDADGDRYCSPAAPVSQCAGNSAPAGLSFPFNCITQNDCNDADPARYRLLSVRPDGDNDGFCFGPATNQCSGATPPTGFRLPNTCDATDDCRDTNSFATTQCVISDGYRTGFATKACFAVPATETFTVSATQLCPLGFTLGTLSTLRTAGTGSCSAVSQTSLTMTCNGLDGATCRISGSCNAL